MTAKDKIKELFKTSEDLTIKEIVDRLGISKQMAHIAIKQMLEENLLKKLGQSPKTIYRWAIESPINLSQGLVLKTHDEEFLQKNFLTVSESGNLIEGRLAFEDWCKQRALPYQKTFEEFKLTKDKYRNYYQIDGFINGIEKIRNTKGYELIWLDELYYLDFYAIERFGKTKLGTLLHFAKQGQNRYLMGIMIELIAERIKAFLNEHHVDAIGFIPPTIRREVQLMKFIQSNLNVHLPILEIKKINGIIPVPQKSLNKLEERIKNARNTFAITDRRSFNNIVLLDDAVGSGATLNEVAGKIKNKGVSKNIIGLAIVGSFKGFDVITDV